jgi:RNA polymerase sigma factor (sigma-70 family)
MDDRAQQAQQAWEGALHQAHRLLRRWDDQFTRTARDDLAQDAALACWRFVRDRRDGPPLCSIMRTISRRMRSRALHVARRGGQIVADSDLLGWADPAECPHPTLRVGGALVPRDWLLPRLVGLLSRLRATNRRIVLAYYEGFSCAELGERFGLSEEAVKVRLHRSRIVLRKRLEAMTRAAGHFEA